MHFDSQPTLAGALLELRPLRADDFPALYAVASDPLIWEQHPNSDRYQEAVFRQFFDDAIRSGGALVAIDRTDGRIIGSSRYAGFAEGSDEVEVGYTFLARRYWGGRYNGEMKRLMVTHALGWFRAVLLLIGPDNIRSQRAALKIGAVPAGSRRQPHGEERLVFRFTVPPPPSIL
jgi:N-acetyltransferase